MSALYSLRHIKWLAEAKIGRFEIVELNYDIKLKWEKNRNCVKEQDKTRN